MKALKALKVVEVVNDTVVFLGTEPETRGQEVFSELNYVKRPRELDDFRLSGVYGKAGVPVEIEEVEFDESKYPLGQKGYMQLTKNVSDSVYEGLKSGKGVLVTGATCTHTPGIAGGIRRAFGKDAKIGIIWMDAHGDVNIPETSHSGLLGGMPFATILGYCMDEWREICGLEPPLDDRYAILTDARSFDKEEVENVKDKNLTIINTADFVDEENWRKQVKELADKVDVLYLHIDADIVDCKYMPDHYTPEPDGPDIWPLLRNMRIVMETGKVPIATVGAVYFERRPTMTVRERKDVGPESSILTGIRMTGTVLGNWKNCPDML